MGTYSRLFVPIFFIIAAIVGLRYTLLLESSVAHAGQRYRTDAQQLAQHLAATLKPLERERDDAAIAALLHGAAADNADLALLRWERPGAAPVAVAGTIPTIAYPNWLAQLTDLAPLYRHVMVTLPGGQRGMLSLWHQPAQSLNQVWRDLRQQAVITLISVSTVYLLLGILIFLNQRMLGRLAHATGRFQQGEHGVRLPVRGSFESRIMASTFNAMAAQVQVLVRTLQEQKDRIEVTLGSIGDAVITTNVNGEIENMNAAAQALTGYTPAQARGRQLDSVFVLVNTFGRHTLFKAMADIYRDGSVAKIKNQSLQHRTGEHFIVEYTATAIRKGEAAGSADGAQIQGAVLVFRDVSEKKQLIQKMSWQSQHDVLTGLPNRNALAIRFDHEIALAREQRSLLAVCLFDLDHFQQINERGGQALGDDILKQVARRLHEFAGPRHYAARLSGDEFVLLLPDMHDRAAVNATLEQLMAQLACEYHGADHAFTLSASVGVALYTGSGISADKLLRHADQALYQAKVSGRGKVHYFDADLDEQVRTHYNRRSEVRAALLAGELCLYYQPKLNMRSGRVVGMEALLRWRHPQRGIVGPMDFLPAVEHSDVIVEIGEAVLRQALAQLDAWRAAEPEWAVSVNIAARHFQRKDFVERLGAILREFPHVPPRMLELEILESSALQDIAHVRNIMQECQALGIRFALDDFGTGYSSMSYLKRLPADVLKIDQSFVRNMLVDRDDRHLVSAIIGLARSFKRDVIAEGVETMAHGALLMQLGCEVAQGYGIARPMPADDVLGWAKRFATAPHWRDAVPAEPAALR